jgi:gas vesicle protein
MAKNNTGKWALGAVLLGAIGYVAGLLTAPKSGKDTRDDLEKTANRVVSEAEKQLKLIHSELNVVVDEAKKVLTAKSGDAKQEVSDALGMAKEKQDKVKELLSALRDGGASDNPELSKATTEAKKALSHLKTFLK